jgi:hypothetical protein
MAEMDTHSQVRMWRTRPSRLHVARNGHMWPREVARGRDETNVAEVVACGRGVVIWPHVTPVGHIQTSRPSATVPITCVPSRPHATDSDTCRLNHVRLPWSCTPPRPCIGQVNRNRLILGPDDAKHDMLKI